ncbi:MAG: AAA family ATPase, partial [Candidatus Nitrosotenuis sp.]
MKKFDDGFYVKGFGELEGSDEGQEKLLMEGIIMGISEIEHYPNLAVLKCQKCKDEVQIHESDFKNWRNFKLPTECIHCGGTYDIIQFSKGNIRKFLFGEDKTSNPITITAFVFKKDVYTIKPGEKIRVNAILHSVKVGKSDTWKRVLDVKQMTTTANKPVMPSDEEIKMFKELDKTKLIDSFAPKIKGMSLIKEGLFIACLGGVTQNNQRGDINTLLMGDPGVAKTQLLKFTASIVQKSDYTSGKSASQAGLLAGVDNLSDGTRIAKPGSVIMCNGGICCIDEFEKMNASDRAGLHEVMENNTFSLRKIGINMTWE